MACGVEATGPPRCELVADCPLASQGVEPVVERVDAIRRLATTSRRASAPAAARRAERSRVPRRVFAEQPVDTPSARVGSSTCAKARTRLSSFGSSSSDPAGVGVRRRGGVGSRTGSRAAGCPSSSSPDSSRKVGQSPGRRTTAARRRSAPAVGDLRLDVLQHDRLRLLVHDDLAARRQEGKASLDVAFQAPPCLTGQRTQLRSKRNSLR